MIRPCWRSVVVVFPVFRRSGGGGDDGGRYSVVVDGELGLVTLWTCHDRVAGAGEVAFSACCWHPSTDDRVFLNVLYRPESPAQHNTGFF